jgi:aminopeptidase N
MVPWAHRFLDETTALTTEGLLAVGGKVRLMMPTTCDQAWLERAQDLADADGVLPVVRKELLLAVDTLTRVLDART